jgi:CHASE3 domain sensor protein
MADSPDLIQLSDEKLQALKASIDARVDEAKAALRQIVAEGDRRAALARARRRWEKMTPTEQEAQLQVIRDAGAIESTALIGTPGGTPDETPG